jgi:hypothetical protein
MLCVVSLCEEKTDCFCDAPGFFGPCTTTMGLLQCGTDRLELKGLG